MSDETIAETTVGLPARLRFDTVGDRDGTYLAAVDHFDRSFQKGWRVVYVSQDLVLEDVDLNGVPRGDTWEVQYDAMGVLRRG